MATIVGTRGDDSLVGTEFDDRINARTGFDTVDGGAGRDTLNVNYSVFETSTARFPSQVVLDATGWSGTIESRVGNDYVTFSNIEVLNVALGLAHDWFIVRADAPFSGQRLSVDAGAGQDRLSLLLVPAGSVTFFVDDVGTVTTSLHSRFSGFEEYDLTLGAGNHAITTGAFDDQVSIGAGTSAIATGAGDDDIVSEGGRGTFDAGADFDTLSIRLEDTGRSTVLSYNSASGAGRISGGTTIVGVEQLEAGLGAGADTVRLTNATASIGGGAGADTFTITRPRQVSVDGGDGIDTAVIDLSRGLPAIDDSLRSDGTGGYDGDLYRDVVFRSLERLTITLGSQGDFVTVDAAPLAQGALLTLDGGLSEDTYWGPSSDILHLDFSSLASATAVVGADGALTFAGGVFTGFETIRITGTSGNDRFEGAGTVDGGAGDDLLRGTAGEDTLRGGDGNDRIYDHGLTGHDNLYGGAGDDRYYMDTPGGWPVIHENAGEGRDTLYSSVDASLWNNVETLRLTGTADITGAGLEGNDTIVGNSGGNLLMGNGGRDKLSGGDGIDQIMGGAGADTLTGGEGVDLFWFDTRESSARHDTITDFAPEDALYFDNDAFTGLAAFSFNSFLPESAFAIGSGATTSAHRIVYDDLTGALYYDADGAGGANQILVAMLANRPDLTAGDIVIV